MSESLRDLVVSLSLNTTANIYAHMDPRAKIISAEAMVRGLGLEDSDEKD